MGTVGGPGGSGGPDFARPVAPGGYAWWYVDAFSDDGAQAFTLNAFVGSVFSPYYHWAKRRD
ncbi:MAG TPA: carotenoid 1,2-hydratase, partial [Rhodospirillum rubrum]|nr:carotenoid 1,2-hydratase [Rhodospirillum rubrum]